MKDEHWDIEVVIEPQMVANGSYGITERSNDGSIIHVITVYHLIVDGKGRGTFATRAEAKKAGKEAVRQYYFPTE